MYIAHIYSGDYCHDPALGRINTMKRTGRIRNEYIYSPKEDLNET